MFELRPYQNDLIEKARQAVISGCKKIILHAPTGAGKTCTSSAIINSAIMKGKKVLFLANRRELIFQAVKTLESCGVNSGVIMAGQESNLHHSVQVASMQTYVRRINLEEEHLNPWFHKADLIICDEAHGSISPSWQKILQSYGENVVVIGLTATPCRADSRGLGEYYDAIVSSIDVGELIEQGYLVPVRYFAPSAPDLQNIGTVAGDYDKKELGKRCNTVQLVGDIFENWARLAGGRRTIIFAVNVKHSIHIKQVFEKNGVSIEHVDAKTPPEERAEILDRLRSGDIQVITNVGILTEGFDFPAADCIVLARPTKSMGLYLQMAGRGLRTYPGKEHLVLLDHGGCVEEHGFVEWSREWSLDGKKKAWSKETKKKEKRLVTCVACKGVFESASKCPDCGTEVKTFGKKIESVDAELKELSPQKATVADKRIFLGMLKAWVPRQKNPNPKRIKGIFRGKFGVWPHHSYDDVAPIEPDQAFLNLMLADQIRYAKRMKKQCELMK